MSAAPLPFRVQRHGVVDSTSERAFAAITAGTARHGDVHVAAAQTAGRGRRGRRWESAPGEGLYASVVLLPPPPPIDPAALTMAAGLAVLDAVRALGLERARLDWPNDVVVGAAKLAGCLVESRGLDHARPHAVVGIGVNVGQRAFSAELTAERAVTSLALEGVDAAPAACLDALLAALPRRLDAARRDLPRLERAWLAATGLAGRDVRVRRGAEVLAGRLEELSIAGGAALRGADGGVERVPLAHVTALEPSEAGESAG